MSSSSHECFELTRLQRDLWVSERFWCLRLLFDVRRVERRVAVVLIQLLHWACCVPSQLWQGVWRRASTSTSTNTAQALAG